MPAFVNVEDNAAGEEGVDCTRQSIVPLMGYQLRVPWDDLQRKDRNELSLRGEIREELEKSEAGTSKKVNARTGSVSTVMMFANAMTWWCSV